MKTKKTLNKVPPKLDHKYCDVNTIFDKDSNAEILVKGAIDGSSHASLKKETKPVHYIEVSLDITTFGKSFQYTNYASSKEELMHIDYQLECLKDAIENLSFQINETFNDMKEFDNNNTPKETKKKK